VARPGFTYPRGQKATLLVNVSDRSTATSNAQGTCKRQYVISGSATSRGFCGPSAAWYTVYSGRHSVGSPVAPAAGKRNDLTNSKVAQKVQRANLVSTQVTEEQNVSKFGNTLKLLRIRSFLVLAQGVYVKSSIQARVQSLRRVLASPFVSGKR